MIFLVKPIYKLIYTTQTNTINTYLNDMNLGSKAFVCNIKSNNSSIKAKYTGNILYKLISILVLLLLSLYLISQQYIFILLNLFTIPYIKNDSFSLISPLYQYDTSSLFGTLLK